MHQSLCLLLLLVCVCGGALDGWSGLQDTDQYHIQTDEDEDRYFQFQTNNGQYRKERRLRDGSVVGTTGWVGADGYLRLQDYIADDQGYRIYKSKTVFVGQNRPIGESLKIAKTAPTDAGVGVTPASVNTRAQGLPSRGHHRFSARVPPSTPAPSLSSTPYSISTPYPAVVSITPPPLSHSAYPTAVAAVDISPNSIEGPTERPYDFRSTVGPITANEALPSSGTGFDGSNSIDGDYYGTGTTSFRRYDLYNPNSYRHHDEWRRRGRPTESIGDGYTPQFPTYDGISLTTGGGFKYYLPKQYHEEHSDGVDKTGSFGYVDPFGIRRVIYYNAVPGEGFKIKKNNRYVGHDATPYDPRPVD